MPLTQVDQGLLSSTAQYTGFKNRIINGRMEIDQRNAGAAVNFAGGNFPVDRMRLSVNNGGSGVASAQQNLNSLTPPTGFTNYIGMTVTTASTMGASEAWRITQRIEGLNTADLAFGTAGASSVALSFWVRSNLTGTFGGVLQNSAANRNYVFSYSISAANTWEYKTITITGDTSGTWLTTNGIGMLLSLSVGAGTSVQASAGSWTASSVDSVTGQVNVLATIGNTFYVTGLQLEKGSTATSFDFRSFGTELALCQRYFESSNPTDQLAYMPFSGYSSIEFYGTFMYKVTKRAVPSVTFNSTAWLVYYNSSARTFTSVSADGVGVNNMSVYIIGSGWAGGGAGFARNIAVNAIMISAEL